MKIHEYQGKDLFRRYGIPVPDGRVAHSGDEAAAIADEFGGRAVVKAQIHAGGRGKGTLKEIPEVHGVKVCKDPAAARAHAEALLGNTLVTHQTGPEGRIVKHVLVEALSDIRKELYLGLVVDRDNSCLTFIASAEGGMEIEKVAAETPDKIARVMVDPASGISGFHARRVAYGLGLRGKTARAAAELVSNVYRLFVELDCSLVEVNPLVVVGRGEDSDPDDLGVMALDAKLTFDDNALFRHRDLAELRDVDEEDAQERQARDAGLSYVALAGSIGCLVNGAGLAMATMDIIKNVGGEPANFLDVGGGATAQQVTTAFKIIQADPGVRSILINIFGGIAKCDVIAEGVVTAAREVGLDVPLIVRLEGTNVERGKQILSESGLTIIAANDMLDAAQKAVSAAGGQP